MTAPTPPHAPEQHVTYYVTFKNRFSEGKSRTRHLLSDMLLGREVVLFAGLVPALPRGAANRSTVVRAGRRGILAPKIQDPNSTTTLWRD